MNVNRVYLLVLDSCGVGALPDCADFGDSRDCHTLQTIRRSPRYHTPTLDALGWRNIVEPGAVAKAGGAYGRCAEKSRGKDTTTGHWEIAGIISEQAMPTFPQGFPPELVAALERRLGVKTLCHQPYSGTQVIADFGREHEATGALIVYTSADSVLQIAAHERVVPVETLYLHCQEARELLTGDWAVGRVIARPFLGEWPHYERTPRRHDFSLLPPADTILDAAAAAGLATIGVGKIRDIFAGRGVGRHLAIDGNRDGMAKTIATQSESFRGLCFVNLVDFDMQFGHRRDIDGYAQAMTEFDAQLATFLARMRGDDLLIITADHGCDPAASGTDHTREYTPLLVCGAMVRPGVDLGTRATFADIAATVAELLRVDLTTRGTSFAAEFLAR